MERNKFLWQAVKVVVFILMTWIIADRIFLDGNFDEKWTLFKNQLSRSHPAYILAAFGLMPVNWSVEAFKWRTLLQSREPFSVFLRSVIAGATFGFVTPGRTGEFVGRVFYIPEENKTRAFYLSALGGIAQTSVTIAIGALAIGIWSNDPLYTGIATGVAAVFLFSFFRYDLLSSIIARIPFLQKRQWTVTPDDLPQLHLQLKIISIALLRYSVYITQYVSLCYFFGIGSEPAPIALRCSIYMVAQTFSPLMPSVDVTYRGGAALAIFEDLSQNALGIVSVSFFGWFINLCIPSVVGYIFLWRKNKG
ncbi:MAG: flippase-like domain-containing protein [Chitinophagales bacterium]|nr:flippase-like domain-containing protein [Chitinophagales bacterium]MDW8418866.1 lysylphosphatidylglycerol synthase domain-containing protein [Chitinophagales bacterium]